MNLNTGGFSYLEFSANEKQRSNSLAPAIIARCVLAFSLLQDKTLGHLAQEYESPLPSELWNTSWCLQGLNILTSSFYPPMSKNKSSLSLIQLYHNGFAFFRRCEIMLTTLENIVRERIEKLAKKDFCRKIIKNQKVCEGKMNCKSMQVLFIDQVL